MTICTQGLVLALPLAWLVGGASAAPAQAQEAPPEQDAQARVQALVGCFEKA